jgi:hypothetical protein
VASDVAIHELLAELGYRSDAARRDALAALVDAGLTNGKKPRISLAKLDAVKDTLAARFVVACARAACRHALAGDPRTLVDADVPTDCSVCSGAANEPAIAAAIAALHQRDLRRLVVVGGSPATHEELGALVGDRIELRLVSGTDRRTQQDARHDLDWADLVIVWGSTQLDHKTSRLYTTVHAAHVVTCAKRGISSLAETILAFTARR